MVPLDGTGTGRGTAGRTGRASMVEYEPFLWLPMLCWLVELAAFRRGRDSLVEENGVLRLQSSSEFMSCGAARLFCSGSTGTVVLTKLVLLRQ